MNKLIELLSLQALKGSRTQITILLFAAVNLLNQLGVLHLTASDLETINKFLTLIGGYFFVEKVQTIATPK